MASVYDATKKAIVQAKHLKVEDAGAIAVILTLAQRIDAGSNDMFAVYLRYVDSLGLTPASRAKLPASAPKPVPAPPVPAPALTPVKDTDEHTDNLRTLRARALGGGTAGE